MNIKDMQLAEMEVNARAIIKMDREALLADIDDALAEIARSWSSNSKIDLIKQGSEPLTLEVTLAEGKTYIIRVEEKK